MKKSLVKALLLTLLISFLLISSVFAAGKVHKFVATPENAYNALLHSEIPPQLTIDSGDTVIFNTLPLLEGKLKAGMTIDDVLALRKEVLSRNNRAYAFTGPFYINGAEPGDVLEIRIKKIVPGDWGITYNYPGSMKLGTVPDYVEEGWAKTVYLSKDKKSIELFPNVIIPVKPFLGTMALSPKKGEIRNSAGPGYYAGNMDNKELVVGTTLFVPVSVPGALFMAADAHAVQGDGEVSITAIETYFEEVVLEFIVRKDMTLERPMAESPTHWITMGFNPSLDEALRIALKDAIDFLIEKKGLSKNEAYALCSQAVDFRITQSVDGDKGVHGMIPKSIFKK